VISGFKLVLVGYDAGSVDKQLPIHTSLSQTYPMMMTVMVMIMIVMMMNWACHICTEIWPTNIYHLTSLFDISYFWINNTVFPLQHLCLVRVIRKYDWGQWYARIWKQTAVVSGKRKRNMGLLGPAW